MTSKMEMSPAGSRENKRKADDKSKANYKAIPTKKEQEWLKNHKKDPNWWREQK